MRSCVTPARRTCPCASRSMRSSRPMGPPDSSAATHSSPIAPRLSPGTRLGTYKSKTCSASAAWARSIARATPAGARGRDQGPARAWLARSGSAGPVRPRSAAARRAQSSQHRRDLRRRGGRWRAWPGARIGRGRTLAERLRAGPLPLDEALAVASQIADALEPRTRKASSTAT